MSSLPSRVTFASISAMSSDELLDAELALHVRFAELDAVERRTKGRKYNLMRGPAELVDTWDQWGRLTRAAQARLLTPRKMSPTAAASAGT